MAFRSTYDITVRNKPFKLEIHEDGWVGIFDVGGDGFTLSFHHGEVDILHQLVKDKIAYFTSSIRVDRELWANFQDILTANDEHRQHRIHGWLEAMELVNPEFAAKARATLAEWKEAGNL